MNEKLLKDLVKNWKQYRRLQDQLVKVRDKKPDPKNVVSMKNALERVRKKRDQLDNLIGKIEDSLTVDNYNLTSNDPVIHDFNRYFFDHFNSSLKVVGVAGTAEQVTADINIALKTDHKVESVRQILEKHFAHSKWLGQYYIKREYFTITGSADQEAAKV